jgi:hypothetical protein
METIGKFRFVLGVVIVSSIVSFFLYIPFAGILNTNDVTSSEIVKNVILVAIPGVSIFLALLYALNIRKYFLPATKLVASLLIGIGFLIVDVVSLVTTTALLPMLLGSSVKIISLFSISNAFLLLKNFIVAIIMSALSLKLLSKNK